MYVRIDAPALSGIANKNAYINISVSTSSRTPFVVPNAYKFDYILPLVNDGPPYTAYLSNLTSSTYTLDVSTSSVRGPYGVTVQDPSQRRLPTGEYQIRMNVTDTKKSTILSNYFYVVDQIQDMPMYLVDTQVTRKVIRNMPILFGGAYQHIPMHASSTIVFTSVTTGASELKFEYSILSRFQNNNPLAPNVYAAWTFPYSGTSGWSLGTGSTIGLISSANIPTVSDTYNVSITTTYSFPTLTTSRTIVIPFVVFKYDTTPIRVISVTETAQGGGVTVLVNIPDQIANNQITVTVIAGSSTNSYTQYATSGIFAIPVRTPFAVGTNVVIQLTYSGYETSNDGGFIPGTAVPTISTSTVASPRVYTATNPPATTTTSIILIYPKPAIITTGAFRGVAGPVDGSILGNSTRFRIDFTLQTNAIPGSVLVSLEKEDGSAPFYVFRTPYFTKGNYSIKFNVDDPPNTPGISGVVKGYGPLTTGWYRMKVTYNFTSGSSTAVGPESSYGRLFLLKEPYGSQRDSPQANYVTNPDPMFFDIIINEPAVNGSVRVSLFVKDSDIKPFVVSPTNIGYSGFVTDIQFYVSPVSGFSAVSNNLTASGPLPVCAEIHGDWSSGATSAPYYYVRTEYTSILTGIAVSEETGFVLWDCATQPPLVEMTSPKITGNSLNFSVYIPEPPQGKSIVAALTDGDAWLGITIVTSVMSPNVDISIDITAHPPSGNNILVLSWPGHYNPDTNYTMIFSYSDSIGSQSSSVRSDTFKIDIWPPTVSIKAPLNDTVVSSEVTLSLNISELSNATIQFTPQQSPEATIELFCANLNGRISLSFDTSDMMNASCVLISDVSAMIPRLSPYTLGVTVVDAVGHPAHASIHGIVVDRETDPVTVLSPRSGKTQSDFILSIIIPEYPNEGQIFIACNSRTPGVTLPTLVANGIVGNTSSVISFAFTPTQSGVYPVPDGLVRQDNRVDLPFWDGSLIEGINFDINVTYSDTHGNYPASVIVSNVGLDGITTSATLTLPHNNEVIENPLVVVYEIPEVSDVSILIDDDITYIGILEPGSYNFSTNVTYGSHIVRVWTTDLLGNGGPYDRTQHTEALVRNITHPVPPPPPTPTPDPGPDPTPGPTSEPGYVDIPPTQTPPEPQRRESGLLIGVIVIGVVIACSVYGYVASRT